MNMTKGDKINLTTQQQFCGGEYSQYGNLGKLFPRNNCHSWREDFTYCSVLDTFYDPNDEEAKEFVKEYVQENDSCIGEGKNKGNPYPCFY